jgi:diguanylate cyclase (GGDEF)-like protein
MDESAPPRSSLALIANDQEWSIRSLESILVPQGYAVVKAYNGRQVLDLARETHPDLIIVDAHLSDIDGIDVCERLLRGAHISPCTPILVTTSGRFTRATRLEALRAGALDFVAFPLDTEELVLKLGNYMRIKLEGDRLREQSLVDDRTGLYNLRGLMRRARELGSEAYRHGRPLACVAFAPELRGSEDDGLNGTGNALDHMSAVFRSSSRVSDVTGRLRSAEFVIIAPATEEVGALELAKRMVSRMETAEGAEQIRLRVLAGYHAVSDLRQAEIQPAALLAGATTALRQSQSQSEGPAIRRYEGNGEY